jgi:radical SAM superfamily enzyme YgiQ (UPF0313 family)
MYFLYGLPDETMEDIHAISNIVLKISKFLKPNQNIRISLNPFIPKAHTPLEREINLSVDRFPILLKRLDYLLTQFEKYPYIKLESLSLQEAYLQMHFSLGNQDFSQIVELYYQNGQKLKKFLKFLSNPKERYYSFIQDYIASLANSSFGENSWNCIDQKYPISILKKEYLKYKTN